MIALTSCSTSFNAMKGGEMDDLYFMASDARVATEFAVRNNNPENFRSINSLNRENFQQENFSARNVNPEYIARYSEQAVSQDGETVYFDDAEVQSAPNVNVYNNFYGAGANGLGWNQPRMNFNLGLGFGFGGGMWGNPWMMPGFGWGGMGMMGMGMWDPFWDPFWPGMGFGPGFGMGFGPGFGWGMRPGFGWNSMWGMNAGFGWGGGMWGNPWMRPGLGWGGFGPGWGWGGPGVIIVNPGWGGEAQRQIVRGARPGRGATMAPAYRGGTGTAAPATARAARRDAASGANALAPSNRTNTGRDFSRSQNDLYNNRSRVASNPDAGNRTTSSAAATRPSRNSAISNANPANVRSTGTRGTGVNSSSGNTGYNTRSSMPSNRSASPSYNRGTTGTSNPSYNRGGTVNTMQRSSTPSRSSSGMTAPSNRSSSFSTAPSRSSSSSSGGGFSSGGGSVRSSGGGGGMSSGGGSSAGGGGATRGGRGN